MTMPHLNRTETTLVSVDTMNKRIAIRAKARKIEHYTHNEQWELLRMAANELAALMNDFCQDPAITLATGEKQQKENQCISRQSSSPSS